MQIIPVRPRAAGRRRLVEALEGESRWTFLRAPAGFDKTATVQAWVQANPRREKATRWIEVAASERVDADAVSALLEEESRLAVLVLDATKTSHPLELSALHALAARARHVVVLARSAHTLPDHLVVLLEAHIFDAEMLSYRPDEIGELVQGIDSARANEICHATAGWPALVRLVASREQHTPLELDRMVSAFVQEKRAQLSPLGSNVLLSSCIAVEPTVALTAQLSGLTHEDARQGWNEIAAEGLAVEDGAGEQTHWRVIPLVREACLSRRRSEEPQKVRELDRSAARWYAERSRPVDAAHHAIAAEDWHTAGEVIEQAAYTLFSTHPGVARDLVARIPSRAIEDHPIARVVSDMLASSGTAEAEFAAATTAHRLVAQPSRPEAVDALVIQHDIGDAEVEVSWREAISRRHEGNFEGALRIQSALDAQFRNPVRPLRAASRALMPMVHLQYGITLMLAGRFVEAEKAFTTATRDGNTGFAAMAQRNALGDLAFLAGVEGDFARAQESLDRMSERPRVIGFWARLVRFGELVAEALVATARLDLATAGAALDSAAETADRDELWVFYLLARARFAVADGSAVAALTEIATLRRTRQHLTGPDSAGAFLLPLAEAELLLALGQTARAGEVLEAAPMHPLLTGVRVLQRFQIGEPMQAIALAGPDLWSDEAGPAVRGLGFLARAAAELQLGLNDDAAASFRFAHKLIVRFEHRRVLGLLPHETIAELMALTGLTFGFELDKIPEMLPAPATYVSMTERELVVLRHLTTGATLASIARTLFVSENTVRTQVRALYRKLRVHNRDEAVAEAHRRGIVA